MQRLGTPFARLWTASTTSNLADGLLLVGAPLLALELTRDPTAIAGVRVATTLPGLLLALPAGVLADRLERRGILSAAAAMRAVLLGVLGIVAISGHLTLPVLYAAVVVFGIGETLFDTTAQSILPDLVTDEQLGTANGRLIGAQTVMNNFVGAPLAGLLVAVAGAAVLLGPAALYLLAALVLLALPRTGHPSRRPAGPGRLARVREEATAGLRVLWALPVLRSLAGLGAVLNLTNAAYFGVFVLFVVGPDAPMGRDEITYGVLAALLAVGAVGGSLLAGSVLRRVGPRRAVLAALSANAAAMLVPVFTAELVPVAAMALVLGAGGTIVNVTIVSARQRIVERAVLGRVNSAFRLIVLGTLPIGAAIGGIVTAAFGLQALFAGAVAGQVLAMLAMQRPIQDAALEPGTAGASVVIAGSRQ